MMKLWDIVKDKLGLFVYGPIGCPTCIEKSAEVIAEGFRITELEDKLQESEELLILATDHLDLRKKVNRDFKKKLDNYKYESK